MSIMRTHNNIGLSLNSFFNITVNRVNKKMNHEHEILS